jgi:hypothetical protein
MRFACTVVLSVTLALGASVGLDGQDMPPLPKPGPEHDLFKMDEGTWDAVVELTPPGAPPMTSKGTQVDTVACGGLCLVTEFKGEMMPGMAFEGHGLTTYDRNKKKYVGSWTDSMSTGLSVSEMTYDPATRKGTAWMEGPDMTGTVVKSKSVSEYPDADHKVMTMYMTGPDGTEAPTLRISYTRRMQP